MLLHKKRDSLHRGADVGHVRYGTFGGNSVETVHPFLRQNNWMHRNLIIAGNFNMTNTTELFRIIDLGNAPKRKGRYHYYFRKYWSFS